MHCCQPARLTLFALAITAVLAASADCAETDASNAKLNQAIDNVRLTDSAGKAFNLHDLKDKKAVVIVTLSFECPVSNSYSSALSEMARTYEPRGVAFIGVVCDGTPAKEVAANAEKSHLTFPIFADEKHTAADALKAEVMPEAFVLDHNFVLRYRGRIDDGWADRLKRNVHIKDQELKAAVDDLLAGKDVRTPLTKAIGCKVRRETAAKATTELTYHRDVLPILQNHCQQCHRPGEVGPFSLMTYKQAVNWAADIRTTLKAARCRRGSRSADRATTNVG
jgi:peroxiredoxin